MIVDSTGATADAGAVLSGGLAWDATLRALDAPRPWTRFAHAAQVSVAERVLLGCYHPSQQNTFTGRLTPLMIDAVLARAVKLAAGSPGGL